MSRFDQPRGDFYSGKMHEEDFAGRVDTNNPAYRTALAQAQRPDHYVPFQAAVRLVKQFQPWDPTNPGKDLLRDLRLEIVDALKLEGTQCDRIKSYTAIGTPLDVLHGIDAFLEWEDPTTRSIRRVTLDLSRRMKSPEELKADLLIHDLPAPEEDAYLDAIANYGTRAVGKLRSAKREPLPSPPTDA
ncbi:hypothetical protein HY632_01685 [Candidatus Uhrbacteria bacterium]|nr:hypothetical protein [Candidatus Uhrbacteria bacterium]